MSTAIRWKQRFENFKRANSKLVLASEALVKEPENELYAMALVQAFEFNYELAWKTLKDYLLYQGQSVQLPRETLKTAYANALIQSGDLWIQMLEDRNNMAHRYDQQNMQAIVKRIQEIYQPLLKAFMAFFDQRAQHE